MAKKSHSEIVEIKQEGDVKVDNINTYNVSAGDVDIDNFINKIYKEFESDEKRKLMLDGIRYYNNESEIDKKKRFDFCGTLGKETNKLANTKYHKNFMRKLTRQKVNYLIGKNYGITTDDEHYLEILESDYFTKHFYNKVYNLTSKAIQEGINWLNVYYDEEGILQFRIIPGHEVKVFWEDREHTKINQLIHFYKISVYEGSEKKDVEYADYYSNIGVIHYIKEGKKGSFVRDNEKPYEQGNFSIMKPKIKDILNDKNEVIEKTLELDEEGRPIFEAQEMVWDKLPWIPLKYNQEELSLINFIKDNQDIYENLISVMGDIILDIPDAIKWFKGYGGTNLEELINSISQYRAVLIDGDGALGSLETKYDPEASNALLDRIRKDVYEDGGGVDVQNDNTGDKSGVVLKFLYSDLDLDCLELEKQLNIFFEWVLWFIDVDIQLKYGIDYSETEVTIEYNKSFIINEKEEIENINSSRDMLPDSVLLPKHPFVEDVSYVKEEIEKEEKENELKLEEQMKRFGNQPFKQDGEEDEGNKEPKKEIK